LLVIIPKGAAAAAAATSRWSLIILLSLGVFPASSKYLVEVIVVFARSASPAALGGLERNAGRER
jgi:hypothetical protein